MNSSSVTQAMCQKIFWKRWEIHCASDLKTMRVMAAQIRNVFSIFVELMQNIIRYGVDGPQPGPADSEKPSFGIVMVSENNGTMDVIAGNFVSNDEAAMLQQKMAFLRDKTREELRGLYRQQLRDTPDGRSKGASLGLIEIARRSTLPINFEFTRTSDDLSFFMIRATV